MAAVLATLAALVAVAGCSAGSPPTEPGAGQVVRVVDGDTLDVALAGVEERVRLIGIDTPETSDPRSPVECFGEEASRHLAALVPPGTAVRLERDVEARDRYGRLLAYLHRASDGLFVNQAMARAGMAAAVTYPPNEARTDEVVAATAEARAAGRGLWGACGGAHEVAR